MVISNGSLGNADDIVALTGVLLKPQLNNAVNILLNENKSSGTANIKPDDLYVDVFKNGSGTGDSNGLRNTINTGNTTAEFAGVEYSNKTIISDATLYTTTSSSYVTLHTYSSINATIDNNVITNEIKANAGYTSVRMHYFYDDATNAYSNVQATNSTSFAAKTYSNPNPTKVVTSIDMEGKNDLGNTCSAQNQVIPTNSGTNKILETNSETITTNPNGFYLTGRTTLEGTGAVTYDVSFDGGSTYQTEKELDTFYPNTETGSSMILKINLKGTGGGNTSAITDYGIALTYGGLF